ncbi:MAG: hypothetical protein V3R13_00005, partial [Nitrososphaerales archaeon]
RWESMRNSLAVVAILAGLLLGVGLGNTIFAIPTPSISTEPLSEVTIELVSTKILQEVNSGTTSTASFIGDFTGTISGAFVAEFFFTIEPNGVFEGIGYLTCNCTVDGRSGTLVERYTLVGGAGALGEVVSRGTWEIVRGTSELSSLRGGGSFESTRFPGELEQGIKTGRIQF